MPIVAKQSEGREPIATGSYHAVCTSVVDLGTQPSSNPKWRARQMVQITWELCDERVEYEDKETGEKKSFLRTISARYPLSLGHGNKPTGFRKMLESWRGRPFTADELAGFDLKNVLGVNGLLTVVHAETPNGTYANVGNMSPLMKGVKKREPESPPLYFTLSDIEPGKPLTWPDTLPEWQRKQIRKSAEYVMRFDGTEANDNGEHDDGAPPHDDDDQIPF